jgi:cyclophilin family peptidyl-prolyl cis-trans isomerase
LGAVLACCVLGLLALVAHTRAAVSAHLEVVHLFDRVANQRLAEERARGGGGGARGGALSAAGGGGRGKGSAFTPPANAPFCAPDALTGQVGTPRAELWGDVVVPGVASGGSAGGSSAGSAAACCDACASTRGCNVWVWCADASACGQQCWLKRVGDPAGVAEHASGGGIPWTSGTLPKDADVSLASLPLPDASIAAIALTTTHGAITLRLRPEWSASSVDFVRMLAAHALCTPACEFYRVEPGFLLQGSLRALIPANNVTTPGPRAMRKGDVGWAGGSAGPDFFIYLGAEPATHWGTDHTVWAEVADDASMRVAEAVVALPAAPTKPGEMHMIQKRVPIEVSAARDVAVA